LAFAVVADLIALLGSRRVVDLDSRVAGLVPAVAVGFGLQVLAGALTYLLPAVWGRGAHGNRRLTAVLEVGWPARVAAWNLGVLLLTVGPGHGWTVAGRCWPASGWARSCCSARRRWPGGWCRILARAGSETAPVIGVSRRGAWRGCPFGGCWLRREAVDTGPAGARS
jgi:hypothetical protein